MVGLVKNDPFKKPPITKFKFANTVGVTIADPDLANVIVRGEGSCVSSPP